MTQSRLAPYKALMLKRKTLESERDVGQVIMGDICIFRFPARDERRVVRNRYVGIIDGQECIKVVYVDGSEATYANWVKLLVEARN